MGSALDPCSGPLGLAGGDFCSRGIGLAHPWQVATQPCSVTVVSSRYTPKLYLAGDWEMM